MSTITVEDSGLSYDTTRADKSRITCLSCNSRNQENLYRLHIGEMMYSFSICKNCSYVFQSLRLTKEHYHDLRYDEPDNYLSHAIERAHYIKNFCDLKQSDVKSILDIGCSRGGVLKSLKVFHYPDAKYSGITLLHDEDKKKYFEKRDGTLIYSDIENYFSKKKYQKYDWIIMSHVVEHLFDPKTTLLNIREHLMSDSSIIYIEVPSFLWGGVRTNPIFSPVHLSYFTVSTLVRLLDNCGLIPIKLYESKIWGNIKVIAKRGSMKFNYVYDWKKMKLQYDFTRMVLHPFYRFKKDYFKYGAND